MISIDDNYRALLLEALEDLMYKTSLRLEALKGQPMTAERRQLTRKQRTLEKLQHLILAGS